MSDAGLLLPNGCRVTHGSGANIKRPFPEIDVEMHELDAGDKARAFRGPFGFIPFTDELRLPRHVHIGGPDADRKLLAERILVLNGVALTELNGEVFLVAPGTLVDIAAGVPHTWTACPAGVTLPDGTTSDGRFLMIYEYGERTGFFPCAGTASLESVGAYEPYTGDLQAIRFPRLAPEDISERAWLVWNKKLRTGLPWAPQDRTPIRPA